MVIIYNNNHNNITKNAWRFNWTSSVHELNLAILPHLRSYFGHSHFLIDYITKIRWQNLCHISTKTPISPKKKPAPCLRSGIYTNSGTEFELSCSSYCIFQGVQYRVYHIGLRVQYWVYHIGLRVLYRVCDIIC